MVMRPNNILAASCVALQYLKLLSNALHLPQLLQLSGKNDLIPRQIFLSLCEVLLTLTQLLSPASQLTLKLTAGSLFVRYHLLLHGGALPEQQPP